MNSPTWRQAIPGSGLLAALGVGSAVPLLFVVVVDLGRNVPSHDIVAGYFYAVIWAITLGMALAIAPVRRGDRPMLLGLWGAKIGVTLGFELIYEAQYDILDGYYYFVMSRFTDYALTSVQIGEGTRNIIIFTRLHNLLFPDSFHMLKVTCAMFGLLGVYTFYRAFVLYLGREEPRLFWILGLCPSILFWSSTFGKDPLIMLAVGLYTYGVVAWRHRHRSSGIVWMLAAILLTSIIRMWMIPLLLCPLLVLGLLGVEGAWRKTAVVAVSGVSMLVALRAFIHRVGFLSIQDVIETVSVVSRAAASGGSSQALHFSSPQAMLAFLPLGMFTALFRPLPGDVMNAFGLLAGLENAVLVALLVVAIWRSRWRDLRPPLILCGTVFVLVWSMFYSVISYINLGGAARFKLQVLPVLLALLLYFARSRREPDAAQATARSA